MFYFSAKNYSETSVTYCGQVTSYVDNHLGQYWLRLWLVAWRHQAIYWTNVDFQLMTLSRAGFNLVNIMAADALAPYVARAPAAMILTV